MRALELFAGAGGLALGVSNAGFEHTGVIEWDHDACASMKLNARNNVKHLRRWPILQADVRSLNYSDFGNDLDLLSGGVPCQPWSQGGKHAGQNDSRNLFPEMVRAVRETQPKVVLVENVKGLLRQSFATYFEYITLSLAHPDIVQKQNEDWQHHLRRLEQHHSSGAMKGLEYKVTFRLVNAADYGVPQKRERVFIVAFRSDMGSEWSFPEATHSAQALLLAKLPKGEYWERHRVPSSARPGISHDIKRRLDRIDLFSANKLPWTTVRDAFSGMPQPGAQSHRVFKNHILVPGARPYAGHTGSSPDEPAKTLKAGDHGVPGGENMLALPDGSVRYFSVRESARLQTFPDEYAFATSWTESMRQIGNAVPVALSEVFARKIRKHILIHNAKADSNTPKVKQALQSA
ncbi:MAG: DNA cytosine methyltransferase [Acidobacteriaceae bacterium]